MTATAATATHTFHPAILEALNFAIAKGCTRQQAIGNVIASLTEIGIPLRLALDSVLGPGTYQMISDTTWELLQPAA